MTRAEAEAANVVLRWVFNRKPYVEPPELARAFEELAAGAHARLGDGVSRTSVREWTRLGC